MPNADGAKETAVAPEEQAGMKVGTKNIDFDEGDSVPSLESNSFSASFESVWVNNAGKMYGGTDSAIDEGLGNAITAVRRANRMFDAWDAGIIVRIVEKGEDELYLTIRDEGIGMSKYVIDNILLDIGSGTGHRGEASNSKFGRGFLALWMLVGETRTDGSGSFTMSTNPRFDDNHNEDIKPPYNVLFRPGKSDYVDSVPCELEDDEYGTRLRFCVRDGITADDIEGWVRNYGKYSRIPIMLERVNQDGSLENDELGGNKIESYYDDAPEIVVEREGLYRAVASPDAEGKVVILDAQTDTNSDLTLPQFSNWSVDIRMLNEDGPIFDSPDESKIGMIPEKREEIENAPDYVQSRYIPEKDYNTYKDERMDEPSGTRDIIELSDMFLEDVFGRLESKIESRVVDAGSKIDNPQDWETLGDDEKEILGCMINENRYRNWNLSHLLDKDTIQTLRTLSLTVRVVEQNAEINRPKTIGSGKVHRKYINKVIEEYDNVFYGHSILERRAQAVWEDGNNAIVKVKSSDYDTMEEVGWTKITNVSKSSIKEMDVSQETVKEFKKVYNRDSSSSSYNGVSNDYDNREIKIHYGTYSKTQTTKVGNIRNYFGDEISSHKTELAGDIGRIVVFTSTSEHQISGNKSLVNQYTATINCVNKVFEEKLSHLDNVIKYENLKSHNTDYTILTSEGELAFEELLNRDLRLVLTTELCKDWIKEEREDTSVQVIGNLLPFFNGTVALLTKYDVYAICPLFDKLDRIVRQNAYTTDRKTKISYEDTSIKFKNEFDRISSLLVNARLPEWDSKEEVESLIGIYNTKRDSTEDLLTCLSKLGHMYDEGRELSSERNSVCSPISNMVIETNRGKMTVQEIKNDTDELAIVPLKEDIAGIMSEIPIKYIEQYINENLRSKGYRNIDYFDSNYILATEEFSTARRIATEVDVYLVRPRNTSTIHESQYDRVAWRTYTELYALYKVKQADSDVDLVSLVKNKELLDGGYHFIESLID